MSRRKLGIFIYGRGLGGNGRYVEGLIDRYDHSLFDITVYLHCQPCDDRDQFEKKMTELGVHIQRMTFEGLPEISSPEEPSEQGEELSGEDFEKAKEEESLEQEERTKEKIGGGFFYSLKLTWYYLKLSRRISEFFRSQNLDILHISLGGFPTLMHVVAGAINARIPKLVTIVHIMEPEKPLRWIDRYLIGLIVYSPMHLIALSQSMKKELIRRFGFQAERIYVVYNGVDTEDYRPEKIDLTHYDGLNLKPGTKTVLIPARLAHVKAHDCLFRAIALEKKRFEKTCFLLAGEGPDREWIEERAKTHGVEANVKFLGFRKDLKTLTQGADAVALSSDNEGFPFVLLEAMACEKPVVSTDAGAVEEMIEIGKTGYIVKRQDPQALAQALLKVLEADPAERIRMGKAGRERVLKSFSLDQMVQKTAALYD